MTRTSANGLLLLAGAVWGMAFVAQSTAMESVGPMLFVAGRFLLATLVLLPFAFWEARRAVIPLTRRDWAIFSSIGGVLFVAMALQQIGLLTTTVTNSGFLTALYVVFSPILTVLLFRFRPHPVVWPAALASLLGIFLLGGGTLSNLKAGDGYTILCAALWALQIVMIGRFIGESGRPYALSTIQMMVAGVLAWIAAATVETGDLTQLMPAWREVVYTAIMASALAFTLQIVGQRYTTAPQAAIFLSSEALFAALFGFLFMGDRIPTVGWLGCALIFAALLAVELVPISRPATRPLPQASPRSPEGDAPTAP